MDKDAGIIIMNWLKDKLSDAALSGNRKEIDTIIQIMKLWKNDFVAVEEE